jgi:hypothetical protein
MADTPRHRPLTNHELVAVTDVIATEGEVAGLVALWSVLLGYPMANHTGPPFSPGSVEIPEAQWHAIAGAMVKSRVEVTNFPGFTMVNTGPGSYG